MTTLHAAALSLGALILASAAVVRPPVGPAGQAPVVLGTFDSRAVAIAYAGSETFRAYLSGLHEELARAQADGDAARVAELEASGPELQARLHRQGFSTAPVDDILAHIEDELGAIAREVGVDVIVSKWDVVWQAPGAELVDVTDHLVEAFDPDERTRKSAREIVQQDPVPAEELRHDH